MQSKTDGSEPEIKKSKVFTFEFILNCLASGGFIVLILTSNFTLVPILFGKPIPDSHYYWSYLGIALVLVGGFGKIFIKIPKWISQKHNL